MTEQFIPYQGALELKELGFDEECFTCYSKDGRLYRSDDWACGFVSHDLIRQKTHSCLSPLWQQAFDWFREKHELFSIVYYHTDSRVFFEHPHYFRVYEPKFKGKQISVSKEYKTYEEARQACLEKLIEIVKAK